MIRILALVTDAWGAYGGIAQFNRDLFQALAEQPNVAHIEVLSLAPCSAPEHPKIHVRDAGGQRVRFVAMALGAVYRRPPSIILCAHIHFMRVAAMMKWLSGRPIWLQVHGIDAWDRPRRMEARAVLKADLVTAVSRYTRARLLSWAALPPEQVHVLPNTVQAQFHPGPRSAQFRQALGLSESVWPVLCTVARLSSHDRYKGIDRVIAALPALCARFPDLVYLVAGSGDDQDRLQADAEGHGVARHVRFLGRIDADALPQLYRESDLFIMPSTKEGFGIVFIEAMACGTLAMGLNVDGSVDALVEGHLGVFADPINLTESVTQSLSGECDRQHLATDTQTRFGKAAFAANIKRLLDQIERRFIESGTP